MNQFSLSGCWLHTISSTMRGGQLHLEKGLWDGCPRGRTAILQEKKAKKNIKSSKKHFFGKKTALFTINFKHKSTFFLMIIAKYS